MTLEEKVLEGLDKGWKLEYLKEKISEGITEERVRDGILNDVRQDAFKKLKSACDADASFLIDAALYILALAQTARSHGLLCLDILIEDLPEPLQIPIQMVADCYPYGEIVEIATNDYWSRGPQGIQAMVSYIYICGALYIREGYSPDALKDALETLFPLNWRQEYRERCEKMELTKILPKYESI